MLRTDLHSWPPPIYIQRLIRSRVRRRHLGQLHCSSISQPPRARCPTLLPRAPPQANPLCAAASSASRHLIPYRALNQKLLLQANPPLTRSVLPLRRARQRFGCLEVVRYRRAPLDPECSALRKRGRAYRSLLSVAWQSAW